MSKKRGVLNMSDKELMYKVASGQIAEPKLTLTVDGEQQIFEGRDARVFALGYLAGCKAMEQGVSIDDSTEQSDD